MPFTRSLRRLRATLTAVAVFAALLVAGAVGISGCSLIPGLQDPGHVDTSGLVFRTPLPVPPLAESTVTGDGTREFRLRAQDGLSELLPGVRTPTSGYNGSYLGPTLRASRGENVRVLVENAMAERTTLHWHGMHLPAAMDGGPHQPIDPESSRSVQWRVDQPAATLWYHPHPHGSTADHVARGLAGMFIVDDESEGALALPRSYGVDDFPVIVQDQRFAPDGRLSDRGQGFVGPLGDTLLVNGAIAPFLAVTSDSVRLRLLNASVARVYNFAFDDDRSFAIIGTDGGLLDAPHRTGNIQLSPGERAEIIVRVAPKERAVLVSAAPDLGIEPALAARNGGGDRFDVLELRAAEKLTHSPEVPARLADSERLDPRSAGQVRNFTLDGYQINGATMDMERIDAAALLGTVEVWKVTNRMSLPHNFHVHDVQFQVATVGGDPPPAELSGWKDTVFLPPGVEFALVMRFDDYADPQNPYMYHCHLLWHEDRGMMGQFVVVAPGQAVSASPQNGDHHAGH